MSCGTKILRPASPPRGGGGDGRPGVEDQKPADRFRASLGIRAPRPCGGERGSCSFHGERFFAGCLVVSFFSNARSRRRRCQAVFPLRSFFNHAAAIGAHSGVVCRGGRARRGKAGVPKGCHGSLRDGEDAHPFFNRHIGKLFITELEVVFWVNGRSRSATHSMGIGRGS